ncbi:MAG: polysaccharide deacetylase family protein [Armatimonadaceae bacterium]
MVKRGVVVAFSVALFALAGCRKEAPKPVVATPVAPERPMVDAAAVRANELGRIPVVMYHDVNDKVGKNTKMNRTKASFEKDLQLLHDKGFYPVTLRSVVDGTMDVPAGKSPVVITFDDARESQFRLIESSESYSVDTESAYGMIEKFCKANPDWKPVATFFVLPKSDKTLEPFGQVGLGGDKIKYLMSKGCEIGNHSLRHKSFARMTAQQLQDELSGAQKAVQAYASDVQITSLANPYGVYPRNKSDWKFLAKGTGVGGSYTHTAVCQAAWRPMVSPAAKGFNPVRIERITPEDLKFGLSYWVGELTSGRMTRYVSDGDVSVVSYPSSEASSADKPAIVAMGKKPNAYGGSGGAGGKKILGAGDSSETSSDTANPSNAPTASKPITGAGG